MDDTKVQYVKVNMGSATNASDRNNILRYYEKRESDRQSRAGFTMTNDASIQSASKVKSTGKLITKHKASVLKEELLVNKIMKEAFIIQDRDYYLPFGQQEYCIGNKSECGHLSDEGVIIIPWNKSPPTEELPAIKSLRLRPTLGQIKKQKFPNFIRELTNLVFLELPLPMALTLQVDSLPKQLRALMITNAKGYIELITSLRQSIIWPDVVLPNLEGLWIFNSFDANVLNTLLEISSFHVPKLKYLDCQNDENDKIMNCLDKFDALEHLQISNIGDAKALFKFANSLKYLTIFGVKNNFSLESLLFLQRIGYVWLNTIKTQLDCELFISMNNLKEINVLNSKKVINAKALLECNNLESIFFLDCKKPFKGIGNLFLERNYRRLDIEYS